jgi:hypothetical protein
MQDKALVTRYTHGPTAARAMDGEGVGSYDIPLPGGAQIVSGPVFWLPLLCSRCPGLPECDRFRNGSLRANGSSRDSSFNPVRTPGAYWPSLLILQRSGPSPGAPLHPVRNPSAT